MLQVMNIIVIRLIFYTFLSEEFTKNMEISIQLKLIFYQANQQGATQVHVDRLEMYQREREREGETETDRQRERERERERDRQTDRQTDRQRERPTDR